MSFNEFDQTFGQSGQENGGDLNGDPPINDREAGQYVMSHQLSSGSEGLIPAGYPPSIAFGENDGFSTRQNWSIAPFHLHGYNISGGLPFEESSFSGTFSTYTAYNHSARGIPVQSGSMSRADMNQKRVAETPPNRDETPLQKAPRHVEPKDEEFEKSLLEYANREFFSPESLLNNLEVSEHSLFLEQPMNYKGESVTAQLDDDTLRNVGAPAFNYGYGGFQTKWIKKRNIEKIQKLTESKYNLMGTVERLQMEVNKKRSEIEEIIENTEKQTRNDARLLERKSIYFFVEETDTQKQDREWGAKFLSHSSDLKQLTLDQLMARLQDALRKKEEFERRRESKAIIRRAERDIRVAERFLGRTSTYFSNEQELAQAAREMRPIYQFGNKLTRCLKEKNTLWKEIMETNCVKTTLTHQFTDVLNMEDGTEQWRPSKVVSIPWVFRFRKSSGLYHLTVDFEPIVRVASGFIATIRPIIGTKKLLESTFKYFDDIWYSKRVFEKTIKKEDIAKYLNDGHLSVKLKVCVKSGIDLRERLEFNKSEERDTCVIVEDKNFFVSKTELASLSPVFDRMFFGGFEESKKSEITLKGIFASDFYDFLLFCGNGGKINNVTVRGIADVADIFDIEVVRLKCIEFISENGTYSTEEKRQFGEEFGIPELKVGL
ncbi:hypothetical protein B9Z55_026703 [Caenorhabditis nigoni]|uniref:BTB domain-containing protein n=1 Tax=Caenorhabditis nigoni TaxID=1611254 RepID=A0A2G5T4G5_9PELO|nr:hypothetical protein B9Z55_026703 [Caenorhabditis nigoni]